METNKNLNDVFVVAKIKTMKFEIKKKLQELA